MTRVTILESLYMELDSPSENKYKFYRNPKNRFSIISGSDSNRYRVSCHS